MFNRVAQGRRHSRAPIIAPACLRSIAPRLTAPLQVQLTRSCTVVQGGFAPHSAQVRNGFWSFHLQPGQRRAFLAAALVQGEDG